MTPRHWLLFAVIAVTLVVGTLLLVAASNREAPEEADTTQASVTE